MQVVIQDNSDDDRLGGMVPDCDRLEYDFEPKRLSFVGNFSRALKCASGQYICYLGDDDAVTSYIGTTVEMMEKHRIPALISKPIISYDWPDSSQGALGKLTIPPSAHKAYFFNPQESLNVLLRQGCVGYLHLDLAKSYHGIVRRDYFEEVRKKTGVYFGGLSPDIFSSIALSCLIQRALCVSFPITIAGASPKSGTSQARTGRHTSIILQNAPHFVGHDDYHWDSLVPDFYSVETIWADTALHAIKGMDKDRLRYFDAAALLARCYLKYPQYGKKIACKVAENEVSYLGIVRGAIADVSRLLMRRVRTPRATVLNDVRSISAAWQMVEQESSIPTRQIEELMLQAVQNASDE